MSKKIWVGIVVVVLVTITLFIIKNDNQHEDFIKIGAILPLSGDAATYGKALQKGMELVVIEINSGGAVLDKPIAIVYEDSGADPKTAVSAINKLINADKVPLIIGDMFSSTTLAIAPIAQKNRVVLISPTASAQAVPAVGDYIFTIYPSDAYDGEFIGEHLVQLWPEVQRVAVVFVQAEAMITCKEAFKLAARQHVQIVIEEVIPPESRDLSLLIPNLIKSKPDAVFVAAHMPETTLLIRQARERGMQSRFIGISTCYDPQIFELGGNVIDELVFSAPYFDTENQSSKVTTFVTDFEKMYNEKPNVWAAYGSDVVKIASAAFSKASSGMPLRDAVAETHDFDGLTGNTTFKPDRTVWKELRLMKVDVNSKSFKPVSINTTEK